MAIEVTCKCGRTLRAKDEHAGKAAKCPHCDSTVQVPLPLLETADPEPISFSAVTLNIGSISFAGGFVNLSLHISKDGEGRVFLYLSEPNSRRQGLMVALGHKQFAELKELIAKTEETVARLQSSREMRRMIEG
jgi:hypothetical protein